MCSNSGIHFIDKSLQGLWYNHRKLFRKKPGYRLSTKNSSSIPKRLNDKTSALQQIFLNQEYNTSQLKRLGVTAEDINSFDIIDSEVEREATSNEFGELIEGRFSGSLKCHQCYVGL